MTDTPLETVSPGHASQGPNSILLESRLTSLIRRGVGRLSDSVKDLRHGGVLAQAAAARQRGNLPAAYWLAREVALGAPADPTACAYYWDVAVEFERRREATPAAITLIEHLSSCDPDGAAALWIELVELGEKIEVHPSILLRLLSSLETEVSHVEDPEAQARAAAGMSAAFEAIANAEALDAPIALRAVTFARDRDGEDVRRLAAKALESPHLHEVKRARLEALLHREPEASEPPILEGLEPVEDAAVVDVVGALESDGSSGSCRGAGQHPPAITPCIVPRATTRL
jgi:hypothetical protein